MGKRGLGREGVVAGEVIALSSDKEGYMKNLAKQKGLMKLLYYHNRCELA